MQGAVLAEKNYCFELNFSNELFTIIAEAEFMEQLGYALAPCLRSVSVQKDRLNRDYEAVQEMLRAYNTIVRKLTSAEVSSRLFLSEGVTVPVMVSLSNNLPDFMLGVASIENYIQISVHCLNIVGEKYDMKINIGPPLWSRG